MIRAATKPIELDEEVAEQRSVATWLDFAAYLARKYSITGDLTLKPTAPGQTRKLRELWALTNLSASDFADEIASFWKLPRLSLAQLLAAKALTTGFAHRFLRETAIFPCQLNSDNCYLVVADPTDLTAVRAVELVLNEPIKLAIASFEDLSTALTERVGDERPKASEEIATLPERHEDVESLRDLASGAPVVRALNDLLESALEWRATDIHIEPLRTGLIIRVRIDGLLRTVPPPPDILPQALVSRIKILAQLNIAERRLPQDGAAHLKIARSTIDIRVATMPTKYGESVVIRLLPTDRGALEVAKVGLSSGHQETFRQLLALPHGIVIVTGPTGSGKTTTLATMLTALNDATRKIMTIEDPIEYELRGINQSQVKPEIGLTFAAALRAFVRQDPDVIMVGEVRDAETANIAIHAALTGHLVLTTLHTESAAAALPRLFDLGVESFLLRSTIRAIVAQRLVRILCDRCKLPRVLTSEWMEKDPRYQLMGFRADDCIHEPSGCEHCNGSGYRGRTGIFEILEITEQIRKLLEIRADAGTIAKVARENGMLTMFEHGISKCRAGITSASEILRVTTAG